MKGHTNSWLDYIRVNFGSVYRIKMKYSFYVYSFAEMWRVGTERAQPTPSNWWNVRLGKWELRPAVTVELQECHDQHTSPLSPPSPGVNTNFVSMFPPQRLRSREQNWHWRPHPGTAGNIGAKSQLYRRKHSGKHYREQDEGGGETATFAFLCRPSAVGGKEE